ncbi:hypothetical protein TRAPUB_8766 [Trametes pubescens]|uniref:Uncharacterized protein n=1 Tax=Trametes pubescens TaxID=154538 RepID=A0A1M2W4J5_TRAPU|nr:hypothetical protein TRAPUB_8766 [Trametes pubescens]
MNSIKRTVQEIFKTKPVWMELPAQRRYCRYPGCGRVFKPIDALEEFCSRECLQDFNWSPPTPWYPPPRSGWWRRGRSDAGPPPPQFPQRAATIQLIPMKGLPPLNLPPLGEEFPKPQRRKGWLGRAGHQHSHSHQGTFRPQAAPPPATVKPRAAPPPATVRPRVAPPPAAVRPRVAPPPATFRPRAEPPPALFIGRPAVAPAAPTLRPRTRAHDLPRPPSSKYKNMPLPPIRCERPLPPLPPRARRLSASGVILPPPYLHFHPELLPQQPVRPRHHAPSRRGPRPRSNSFGGFRFPPPAGHSNQRHHNH